MVTQLSGVVVVDKRETKVTRALKELAPKVKRVGDTNWYYFPSDRVSYIVDGTKGVIYSVALGNGTLEERNNRIYLVVCGIPMVMVDTASGWVSDKCYACEGLRGGVKRQYPYVTLSQGGSKVNIYSKHVVGLCKYGVQIIYINGKGKETVGIKWHDSELVKGLNGFANIYYERGGSMDTVEVGRGGAFVL